MTIVAKINETKTGLKNPVFLCIFLRMLEIM